MMLFISTTLLISITFILPITSTPINLGLSILFMAFLITGLTSSISSSWFAMIMFIIYISGMLVMFSYFAAISPNQKLNMPLIILSMILTFFLLSKILPLSELPNFMTDNTQDFSSLTYFTAPPQGPLLISLAAILLLALIFVVKIANPTFGPLRPFM